MSMRLIPLAAGFSLAAFAALAALVLSSDARAALPEDVPTCRCVEELLVLDESLVNEATRRAAERLWDSYCDANYPLEDASGHEQSIADRACEIVFGGAMPEDDSGTATSKSARVLCTLVLSPTYQAHGLGSDVLRQWRHHYAVGVSFRLDWRPRSLRRGTP